MHSLAFDVLYPESNDQVLGSNPHFKIKSESLRQMSLNRFHKRFSGIGIIVKKETSSGKHRFRNLSYSKDKIIISSIGSKKIIDIININWCVSQGKDIMMYTHKYGNITLVVPKVTDAIAFKNMVRMK